MSGRGYVICCTPRSGSNHFCELLASTGVLGRPLDWFNGAWLRAGEDPDYPRDPESQLAAILTRGRGANGIYGLKMFCGRFEALGDFDWTGRLPDLRWIFLERRDLIGQAISDVRAGQTQQWRSYGTALREPRYDRIAIDEALTRIVSDNARWQRYFARNAIEPLRLTHEAIVAEPHAAVTAVGALMGLADPPVIESAKLKLSVQRDAVSNAWRTRYLGEAGGLGRIERLAAPNRLVRRLRRLWHR